MTEKRFIAFDIETAPQPKEKLDLLVPDFKAPGNWKDADKIRDNILEQRAKWYAEAALSPFTGRVLIIGLLGYDGTRSFLEGEEKDILAQFWGIFDRLENAAMPFVFWSGRGAAEEMFDIDFIVTRSRILGVEFNGIVRQRRYYTERIVDLTKELLLWHRDQYLKLTTAAELFNLYDANPALKRKLNDDLVKGENFHLWYTGQGAPMFTPQQQRRMALDYLGNDLGLTAGIAPHIL